MSLNRPPVTPWIDRSGTITTGGTAQQLMPANYTRIGVFIQNLHATETLWVKMKSANGTDAQVGTPGNIAIPANNGVLLLSGYTDPGIISVVAATAGHAFTAAEWGA